MTHFLLRRIASAFLLLLLVSVIIFIVVRLLPSDPVITRLGAVAANTSEDLVEQLRSELGLDEPIYVQYLEWIGGIFQGDFGLSFGSQYPVSSLIAERLPATAQLTSAAILVALLIAVPASVAAAIKPDGLFDRFASAIVTIGMAIPQFWLGIMFVIVFAVGLEWLPARGYVPLSQDPIMNAKLLLMPALALGITIAAPLMRFLRSSLAEVTSALYMRTAEGKGVPWRTAVVKHALPNALITTLTTLGMLIGQLIGGVVLIEYIFGWPGLGSLTVSATTSRDYPVLQGVVLLLSACFVLINLLVDVMYGFLNPRMREDAS